MNRIEPIKAAVSPSDAAERYGLKASRNGMMGFIRTDPGE